MGINSFIARDEHHNTLDQELSELVPGEAQRGLKKALQADLDNLMRNTFPHVRDLYKHAQLASGQEQGIRKIFKNIAGKEFDKYPGVVLDHIKDLATVKGPGNLDKLQRVTQAVRREGGRPAVDGMASSILRRMGGADSVDGFSEVAFMRQWRKLTPKGRDALFGATRAREIGQNMEILAELTRFVSLGNPSGTGAANQLLHVLHRAGAAVAGGGAMYAGAAPVTSIVVTGVGMLALNRGLAIMSRPLVSRSTNRLLRTIREFNLGKATSASLSISTHALASDITSTYWQNIMNYVA